MWMDEELGGSAREIIYELNQGNASLEKQVVKLEEKLSKKKKKTKMIKKKKQAQFNITCIVMISLLALIVMICMNR